MLIVALSLYSAAAAAAALQGAVPAPQSRMGSTYNVLHVSAVCCALDTDEEWPLASYVVAATPAAVCIASGQPGFAAVLVPLLALSHSVQAPPAAAIIVATMLYDAFATLMGDRSGLLVALTSYNVAAAALSLRVADGYQRQIAASTVSSPHSLGPSAEALPQKDLTSDELELLELKREALRQRKSWDARLQWRERKRKSASTKGNDV